MRLSGLFLCYVVTFWTLYYYLSGKRAVMTILHLVTARDQKIVAHLIPHKTTLCYFYSYVFVLSSSSTVSVGKKANYTIDFFACLFSVKPGI